MGASAAYIHSAMNPEPGLAVQACIHITANGFTTPTTNTLGGPLRLGTPVLSPAMHRGLDSEGCRTGGFYGHNQQRLVNRVCRTSINASKCLGLVIEALGCLLVTTCRTTSLFPPHLCPSNLASRPRLAENPLLTY